MSIKLQEASVKAGRIIPVYNKKRRTSARKYYHSIWVEDYHGGNERCLLFTDYELQRAEKRAVNNPEDLTKKGWVTDMMD